LNPQPLPPGCVVKFDPLLEVPAIPATAPSTSAPIVVQGHFTQSGQLRNPVDASAPTSWSVDVSYTLVGQASETLNPPGTPGSESTIEASYQMSGREVTVLTIQSPSGPQQILQNDDVTVHGGLSEKSSRVSGMSEITGNDVTVVLGDISSPSFLGKWLHQTTIHSNGTLMVTELHHPFGLGSSLTASLDEHDEITASFLPEAVGGLPPQPGYQVDAVFDAQGSLTEDVVPGWPWAWPPSPCSESTGHVVYQGDYSETITPPSTTAGGGSTQSLRQVSLNTGDYQNLEFEPGR
jgi:hypothetical protein